MFQTVLLVCVVHMQAADAFSRPVGMGHNEYTAVLVWLVSHKFK